jgi:hypothetical protein
MSKKTSIGNRSPVSGEEILDTLFMQAIKGDWMHVRDRLRIERDVRGNLLASRFGTRHKSIIQAYSPFIPLSSWWPASYLLTYVINYGSSAGYI